jgi:hypothetical protein
MPEDTDKEARQDEREGKSPSTQAGEFIREEVHHIREGKHGARSPQQAIAIGLSKARRAGIPLPPPKVGRTSAKVRKQAERDLQKGRNARGRRPSRTRSRAISGVLKREGHWAGSRAGLSRQARKASARHGPRVRHKAAMKAIRTKGAEGMRKAARKAARTRASHT